MTLTRYARKLARIRAGDYTPGDYILADAKDSDLTGGVLTTGPRRDAAGRITGTRTRPEFLAQMKAVLTQDVVDILLASTSNLEALVQEGAFAGTSVAPAFRANETTDIWKSVRGGRYDQAASRPYRGADLAFAPADLCLYSITFNNDTEADAAALEAYAVFRREARVHGISHFLEVFNPNLATAVDPDQTGAFVTDCILRLMASLTRAERPEFLKVAYNGPDPMEELAGFDPALVVGVLGGSGTTHRDTFELVAQSERHGARLALFGRKINQAEDQCALISWMRQVADGTVTPAEAVRGYHGDLVRQGLTADRELDMDLAITDKALCGPA